MLEYKYFVAQDKGVVHSVLDHMENAGGKVIRAFKEIEKTSADVPAQITINGHIKGLCLMPSASSKDAPEKDVIVALASAMNLYFTKASTHMLGTRASMVAEAIEESINQNTIMLDSGSEAFSLLTAIACDVGDVELDPNLAVRISRVTGGLAKGQTLAPPKKAAVRINGQDYFPEAARFFTTWFICQPFIAERNSNYVFPDCKPIEPEEFAARTGFEFDDLRHDHELPEKEFCGFQKSKLAVISQEDQIAEPENGNSFNYRSYYRCL